MALSQFSITSAKPKAELYMPSEGHSLNLFVYRSGYKLRQLRYRFHDKAHMLALGSSPRLLAPRKERGKIGSPPSPVDFPAQ